MFSGLHENGLLDSYSHLLTGYIGKDSFLTEVGAIVKAIREVNPNIVYGKLSTSFINVHLIRSHFVYSNGANC